MKMYRGDDLMNDISFHDSASSVHGFTPADEPWNSRHGFLEPDKKPLRKKSRRSVNDDNKSKIFYNIKKFFVDCYEAICVPKTISIGEYRKSNDNPNTIIKSKPIIGISSTASSLNIDNFRAALLQETVSASEVEKIFNDTRAHLFVDIGGNTLLNPRSTFILYWQTLNLLVTVISLLIVPVEVAFSREEMGYWFLVLGSSFEMFFTADLLINFNLPVQDKASGFVVGERLKILSYYFRFWFWIDFVSALPFDTVSLIIGNASSYHASIIFASLRIVRVLKVSVMLRMLRADLIITNLQGFLSTSHEQLQLVKLLFYMLVTIHSLACGLFLVAEVEQADINWLEMNNLMSAHVGTKYIVAVYWAAMTATTIGYGDVIMSTTIERAYSVAAMVIGASTYAFVTSRLVGMIIYGNRFKNRYSDIRSELLNLMRDIELPMVYRAIAGDFLFHWYHTRQKYDTHELLETMSPQLRGLIAQHMHGEWLRNISFLRNVKHPNDLAAAVALALVHQMYMPGEYIIKHGDECKALYVVDEGRLTRAGGGVMTSLNRFDYFGEEMILTVPCRAGYVVINGIRESCFELIKRFHELGSAFRKARVKIAFRRRVKKLLRIITKAKRRSETLLSMGNSNSLGFGTPSSSSHEQNHDHSHQLFSGMVKIDDHTFGINNNNNTANNTSPKESLQDRLFSSTASVTSYAESHDIITATASAMNADRDTNTNSSLLAQDTDVAQLRGESARLAGVLTEVSRSMATLQLRLEAIDASSIFAIHSRSGAIASGKGSGTGMGIGMGAGMIRSSGDSMTQTTPHASVISWRKAPHEQQTHSTHK
eukprot:gene9477-19685_t